MKPTLQVLVLAFFFLSAIPFAAMSQQRCSFDEDQEERLKDPLYQEFLKDVRSEIRRISDGQERIACTAGTIEFPVAIHYNWTGIGSTVTACMEEAAINSIDALNDDYLALNADLSDYDDLTATCDAYYPASAKSDGSCIRFCIAEYDHPGCSGLCDGDLAITAGMFEYPNTGGCYGDYINIFVQAGTGQLGIAPLFGVTTLGGNGPQVDVSTWGGPGVNCTTDGQTFNSNGNYNLGRTLTHEMGHYFGLAHTFVGDCSTDDGYNDTPAQSDENGGKPVVVNCDPNDAANTANNSCGTMDMWCSYMDYSDDTHLFMFTTEQSDEQYASAQISPIADSAVKCAGGPAVPTADIQCPSDVPVFCNGDAAPYTLDFMDNSTRCPTSWAWTFAGAGVSPTSSTMEDPSVTVTMTGDLTVTLTATNAQGASTMVTKNVYVSIADGTSCPDCGPDFVDTGGPNNPYSANETTTWTYCADAGENLELNLTEVDLPGSLFTDVVRIYDGMAATGNYVAILGENNGSGGGIWTPTGTGSVSFEGSTWTSPGECLTFEFTSNTADEGAGWVGTLECKVAPSCTDGLQNQDEEFVDCGGPNCDPCPSACGFTFTDTGGVDNPYSTSDSGTQWLLCADDADQILNMDFSTFQDGGAALLVYEGDINVDNSNVNSWAYNVQQGGYFTAGAGYSQVNPISSAGQCFTFYFSVTNASTPPTDGFEALVNCCSPDDLDGCANANTAGEEFMTMVDNYCTTSTIDDITSFNTAGEADTRNCTTLAGSQTFYEITCDSDGGTLNVDVSANSEGGTVDAALYGPVSGTCPNYTGGSQVACDSASDPAMISVEAMADEVYLLVVASDTRGSFDIVGSGSAFEVALPVELIKFDAKLINDEVQLGWEVATEINHDYYTIEKSENGTDYFDLANVDQRVEGTQSIQYQYIDRNLSAGTNYYRLSQTDLDGTSKVLATDVVNTFQKSNRINLYPNPTGASRVTLDGLDTEVEYTISVSNIYGAQLSRLISTDDTGSYDLDIESLSAGVYFISLDNGVEQQVLKFIKL